MPSRILSNSGRNSQKISNTPSALASSSTIGAEIGATSLNDAFGPRITASIGCKPSHSSTNLKKTVLNGKASAVAMHPPHRKAAATTKESHARADQGTTAPERALQ